MSRRLAWVNTIEMEIEGNLPFLPEVPVIEYRPTLVLRFRHIFDIQDFKTGFHKQRAFNNFKTRLNTDFDEDSLLEEIKKLLIVGFIMETAAINELRFKKGGILGWMREFFRYRHVTSFRYKYDLNQERPVRAIDEDENYFERRIGPSFRMSKKTKLRVFTRKSEGGKPRSELWISGEYEGISNEVVKGSNKQRQSPLLEIPDLLILRIGRTFISSGMRSRKEPAKKRLSFILWVSIVSGIFMAWIYYSRDAIHYQNLKNDLIWITLVTGIIGIARTLSLFGKAYIGWAVELCFITWLSIYFGWSVNDFPLSIPFGFAAVLSVMYVLFPGWLGYLMYLSCILPVMLAVVIAGSFSNQKYHGLHYACGVTVGIIVICLLLATAGWLVYTGKRLMNKHGGGIGGIHNKRNGKDIH